MALARVEGYRDNLAVMVPKDDPVTEYEAARVELENATVDYNYCLYFPSQETFRIPPRKRQTPPKRMSASLRLRCRIWDTTKQCMREGTLQDLKNGKISVIGAETMEKEPSAPQLDPKEIESAEITQSKIPKSRRLLDLENAAGKLHTLIHRLSVHEVDPDTDPLYEPFLEKMNEGKADLNYCQYFPSNEEYVLLSHAKKGLQEPPDTPNREEGSNTRGAQIYRLAQQCAQDGTLQELKDERFKQSISDLQAPSQSLLALSLQASSTGKQAMTLKHSRRKKKASKTAAITCEPEHNLKSKNAVNRDKPKAASRQIETKKNGEAAPSQINMVELSPEPEGASRVSQNGFYSDEGLVLNTYENERLPSLKAEHSKGAEMSNQISDEVDSNQTDVNGRIASDGSDCSTDADSNSEDGDGTLDYEDSEPEQAAEDAVRMSELKTMPDLNTVQTLAELSPQDLNAQLRYFHVTRKISEVHRSTPVRCLVCSSQGHMAELCDQLTCNICGAFNHHTTQDCPLTAKCSKCRELGHDREHCPYKLKKLAQSEIVCELCQRKGHIEEDCELQWRTSGRPWESNLRGRNVRLSCYECGRSGHLGNDCPTRRPGKQLGSSTWSSGDNQISIKSKGELSIKGTARHDPIDIDDGQEKMVEAFLRPKVPEPVRKGKIMIKTGPKPTFNDLGPNSGWNPVNAPYNSGRVNEPSYGRYRDDGRGDWQAAAGARQQAVSDRPGYESYGQSNRRSRSPEYRKRDSYDYCDRSQPPAPRPTHQGSRSLPGADVYRPMPSSAQNAWSRHRL